MIICKANNVIHIIKLHSHWYPEKFWMTFSPVKCTRPFMIWSSYLFGLFCQMPNSHQYSVILAYLKISIDSSTLSCHFLFFKYISSTLFIWIFFLTYWVLDQASHSHFPFTWLTNTMPSHPVNHYTNTKICFLVLTN